MGLRYDVTRLSRQCVTSSLVTKDINILPTKPFILSNFKSLIEWLSVALTPSPVSQIINGVLVLLLFNQFTFGPSEHYLINQACYGSTYGMILVMIPMMFGVCAGQPRPKKTGLLIAGIGCMIFIGTGIYMAKETALQVKGHLPSQTFDRLMAGAIFALILGLIFLIHFFVVLTVLIHRHAQRPSVSVSLSLSHTKAHEVTLPPPPPPKKR